VILEGGASQVLNEIRSPLPHLSKSGHLTESIIQELHGHRSAQFVHVKKDCNSVAYTLAKVVVRFCKEVGFFEVILDGGASQVVNEIRSPLPHLSKSGHLIESIVQEPHGRRSAQFVHVKRDCNSVAYSLAKVAMDQNISDCWLEEAPICIAELIIRECLCL